MHFIRALIRPCLRALAVAGIVLIPSPAGAQVLEPGARVRVTEVDGRRRTAAFESMDADSIRLATPRGSITLPLSSLAALDISTGRHRRFRHTMAATTGAFAALGGVTWAATYKRCDDCIIGRNSRADAFLWGATAWGLAGVPAGIIAASVIRYERWAPLYRPAVKPLRVSVRPVLGRSVGFAATVTHE